MNSIPHADVFFLVATIGFIIIFALLVVVLIYIISLFKSVNRITKKIENNIDTIGDTAKDFVVSLWDSSVFSWIFGKKRKSKNAKD
ncbi:MAG: hypothetical protein ABIO57_02115 [Candidatus Paceibacterota bacterium]